MEERQARWHLIAGGRRWQCTRSGGGVGGSPVGHEVGKKCWPWCVPCASVSGEKRERRGWGSLDKEACERRAHKKIKEGGSGMGTKRVRRHAVDTRAWHTWAPPLTASAGHAATATQRVQRGPTSHRVDVKLGVPITPDY
jgi:hypothetical protein